MNEKEKRLNLVEALEELENEFAESLGSRRKKFIENANAGVSEGAELTFYSMAIENSYSLVYHQNMYNTLARYGLLQYHIKEDAAGYLDIVRRLKEAVNELSDKLMRYRWFPRSTSSLHNALDVIKGESMSELCRRLSWILEDCVPVKDRISKKQIDEIISLHRQYAESVLYSPTSPDSPIPSFVEWLEGLKDG